MKKLLLLFTLAPCIALGQMTYVPDDNFESYLEFWYGGDGIPNNDYVLTANINTITALDCISINGLSDLTGIEDFTALTELECYNAGLTFLDVSGCTALTILSCDLNQLTSLDVSGATALTYLNCWANQLTSLDVSNNTALTVLNCGLNQLTSLDVSNNTALTELWCYENDLTSLDLSNNAALTWLTCSYNQLTCLNVKNGNNTNMGHFHSNYGITGAAEDNPNLTCIEVDDVGYSNTNWVGSSFMFDPQTSFSEDCNYPASCWIVGIEEEPPTKPKDLLYITDILGRTTLPNANALLFYIYDDGSVEKRIQLER